MTLFNLAGKTAIITGGGSGIGRAICTVFAKQGATVYLLDVDETGAAETITEINKEGAVGFFKKCNIADSNAVNAVIQEIVADKSTIDIIVNNAGIAHVGSIENTTPADVDRLFAVNVKGMFHVIQAAIPYMKQKGGVITNMASIATAVGLPDRFAYSMTKGAVVGMTLSVAKDYLQYNIRCNSISPARVHTPFVDGFIAKNYPGNEAEMFKKLSKTQPIGRMGKPEEVAHLALYLCSDEASFITGCDYPIDGGFTRLNN
jgi:2-keto-3-deoxy-L-fuconate dehydrogenase